MLADIKKKVHLPFAAHTDHELLKAIRLGNEKAFAEFFKRYWRKVHAMAWQRVRSEDVTQEIVQDLFISLWKRREKLDIQDVSSYLYISVKHRVLNHLESRLAKGSHWNEYRQYLTDSEETTQHTVAFNDLMNALEQAVNRLPEKSGKVFRLSFFEGHSVSEIADALKVSEKTIEYHLTRSFKKLRVYLRNYTLLSLTIFESLAQHLGM